MLHKVRQALHKLSLGQDDEQIYRWLEQNDTARERVPFFQRASMKEHEELGPSSPTDLSSYPVAIKNIPSDSSSLASYASEGEYPIHPAVYPLRGKLTPRSAGLSSASAPIKPRDAEVRNLSSSTLSRTLDLKTAPRGQDEAPRPPIPQRASSLPIPERTTSKWKTIPGQQLRSTASTTALSSYGYNYNNKNVNSSRLSSLPVHTTGPRRQLSTSPSFDSIDSRLTSANPSQSFSKPFVSRPGPQRSRSTLNLVSHANITNTPVTTNNLPSPSSLTSPSSTALRQPRLPFQPPEHHPSPHSLSKIPIPATTKTQFANSLHTQTIHVRPSTSHEVIYADTYTIYRPIRTKPYHLHEHRTVIQPIVEC